MSGKLSPDYLFYHYYDITPEFLQEQGIKYILSDIDNTLAPYEMPLPDQRIIDWVESLHENGISIALISNNGKKRVELFNSLLDVPAFHKSQKPRGATLLKALDALGGKPSECAVLGDQLLTDVLAARSVGVRAIVVPPIKDKLSVFFKFKRLLERPIMRRYIKKYGYHTKGDVGEEEKTW